MVTAGIFPFKENSHGRAGNRTRDLMINSQRLWPLDQEAGHSEISNLIKIRTVTPKLLQTDRHDKANHCFSQFFLKVMGESRNWTPNCYVIKRLEVIGVVLLKLQAIWCTTPCRLDHSRRFRVPWMSISTSLITLSLPWRFIIIF